MGRPGMPLNPSDARVQRDVPKIPDADQPMSLHYFGRRSDREKYDVTPESFLEMDLNALLIKDKIASFLYLAKEESLESIQNGSVLVVDRSLTAQIGNVVVVGINGEILLHRFVKEYNPQKQRPLPALITDKGGEST